MQINHPSKQVIPISQALAEWTGRGCWQVKLDGCFTVLPVAGGILVGETIGNRFAAFDCAQIGDDDARIYPLADRLRWRGELCREHGLPEVHGCDFNGADLLKRILDAGLEGVVLKSPGSYYEPMIAAKRAAIYVCRVTEAAGARQSVRICNAATGQDYGRVPARGGAADILRVGNLIRVEAFDETEKGKLREARLCREYLVN